MKLNHQITSPRHSRHGFSLIELLVVIVIIGILMALILPALNGARIRARITQVSTEITQLDQALVSFENRFKSLPPSSLTIPT
ncbi:MAG: prepilin-type N-terminal cleavage/methylation domain-containing protein, partial [Planctomycetota bacterium]